MDACLQKYIYEQHMNLNIYTSPIVNLSMTLIFEIRTEVKRIVFLLSSIHFIIRSFLFILQNKHHPHSFGGKNAARTHKNGKDYTPKQQCQSNIPSRNQSTFCPCKECCERYLQQQKQQKHFTVSNLNIFLKEGKLQAFGKMQYPI